MQNYPAFRQIMQVLKQSGLNFNLHAHTAVCTMEEAAERVPHLTHNLIKIIEMDMDDLIGLASVQVAPITKPKA